MEFMENYTMSPAKRLAESAPMGLEKRSKISGEQDDTEQVLPLELFEKVTPKLVSNGVEEYEVTQESDGEMSYCAISVRSRKGPNYVHPDSPISSHTRSCPSSPPPPPPTSEDVENNRLIYCHLCAKYVDHYNYRCPIYCLWAGYRFTEDGHVEYFRCSLCGKDDHPGEDCPPSPPYCRTADDYDEDEDF